MYEVDDDTFEQLLAEAIDALPKIHTDNLRNVAILIDDFPTPYQMQKSELKPGNMLLGLYEGIPLTRRGAGYNLVLPDKITLFRKPIMAVSQDQESLKQVIRNTIWHEIAHYYGLGHDKIHEIERHKGLHA
jgi:predicted Zn-dependent protease with MMP-like domain